MTNVLQLMSHVKFMVNVIHIVGQDGVRERSLEAEETMGGFLEEVALC